MENLQKVGVEAKVDVYHSNMPTKDRQRKWIMGTVGMVFCGLKDEES
ncbi:MAG: hypothetical protein IJW67_02025 [Blautia sp.]|nr:hypothetical protein [Blautia sp.]